MLPRLTDTAPAFEIPDRAALYAGDVLQLAQQLPADAYDLAVVDPPYCSGALHSTPRKADPVIKYAQHGNACGRATFSGDNRDQRSFTYWCTLWLADLYHAAKPSAYLFCFTDWRQLPTTTDAVQAAGWTWRGVIAWDKGRGSRSPHKGYARHQCEYIVWATKGPVPKLTHFGPLDGAIAAEPEPSTIVRHKVRRSDKHHLTGKPTSLLREIVQVCTPDGIVFDAFAGSSTTGAAALLEGRRFIGFELSQDYIDVSAARLQAAARGEQLPAIRPVHQAAA